MPNEVSEIAIGMVHGRWQPFHNEHLEYLLRAFQLCRRLVVGLTNPEPSELRPETTSQHRGSESANPYTFFQRTEMVRETLRDLGKDLGRVTIVPLHLYSPEKWRYYLPDPRVAVQYVRLFSAWEEKKIASFREYGFRVVVLDPGKPKLIEGISVRQLMADGDENWRNLVPAGTARVIDLVREGAL